MMKAAEAHTIQHLISRLVSCRIREYQPADFAACVDIYLSNEPDFYPKGYLHLFTEYLAEEPSDYLVIERDGKLIACGGIELNDDGMAPYLTFGLVHRLFHGQGIGSTLLAVRLALIRHTGQPTHVCMMTSTVAASFYAQYGFQLDGVEADYLGHGWHYGHLYRMVYPEEIDLLRAKLTITEA